MSDPEPGLDPEPGPGRPDPEPGPDADRGPGPRSEALAFWTERHLCTLATVRPDGSPHVVPVGAVYDPETGLVRIITSGASLKARRILAAGSLPAAVTQIDGRRWTTLEGVARVNQDPGAVADAERRYAARYRTPRVNPLRVVIEIEVRRVLGTVQVPLPRRAGD